MVPRKQGGGALHITRQHGRLYMCIESTAGEIGLLGLCYLFSGFAVCQLFNYACNYKLQTVSPLVIIIIKTYL